MKFSFREECRWIKKFIKIVYRKITIRGDYFVLVGTPEHGNMGDHAIAEAVYRFVDEQFVGKKILEVPSFIVNKHTKLFRPVFGKKIILINGGGYLGTLWIEEEEMVLNVISTFKNKIVILPQSVFYDESSAFGKERLEIAKNIYESNPNVFICAREKRTYDFCKRTFENNKVELVPDMVLNLDYNNCNDKRKDVLLCFRKDKESVLNDDIKDKIESKVLESFKDEKIDYIDTVLKRNVYLKERKNELNSIMDKFLRAKIVFTDRLHGMVFATITGTPCIVFNNCNHKVEGVFAWIEHDNNYVKFVNNIDEIDKCIQELEIDKNNTYVKNTLKPYFAKLVELMSS